MLYGGMPRIPFLEDDKDKKDYLSSLYSELYIKDIVERNHIEREDILGDILDFLASQISSLTNPTNIANAISALFLCPFLRRFLTKRKSAHTEPRPVLII